MLKILLADNYTILRIGLIQILSEAFPHAIVGEARDSHSLLNKVAEDKWDIIISGLNLSADDGIDIIYKLKNLAPDLPILICGLQVPKKYINLLLKAGASGYIDRASEITIIVMQVKKILSVKE